MFDIKGSSTIGSIGERNVAAVKETLRKLSIKLIAEDVGENYGRTIIFDSSNGSLTVKSFERKKGYLESVIVMNKHKLSSL